MFWIFFYKKALDPKKHPNRTRNTHLSCAPYYTCANAMNIAKAEQALVKAAARRPEFSSSACGSMSSLNPMLSWCLATHAYCLGAPCWRGFRGKARFPHAGAECNISQGDGAWRSELWLQITVCGDRHLSTPTPTIVMAAGRGACSDNARFHR